MENTEITKAREKYKPEKVKLLLIAEAPPESIERFFYYENVREHDYLFVEFVKTLLGDDYWIDVKNIRKRKEDILKCLKSSEFYLMDLSDVPCSENMSMYNADNVISFVDRLGKEEAIDRNITNIILVKATVYDAIFPLLKIKGYNVQPVKIPFPSSGQQKNYRIRMRKALENTDFNTDELSEKIRKILEA